jgi:hypothetical protein
LRYYTYIFKNKGNYYTFEVRVVEILMDKYLSRRACPCLWKSGFGILLDYLHE